MAFQFNPLITEQRSISLNRQHVNNNPFDDQWHVTITNRDGERVTEVNAVWSLGQGVNLIDHMNALLQKGYAGQLPSFQATADPEQPENAFTSIETKVRLRRAYDKINNQARTITALEKKNMQTRDAEERVIAAEARATMAENARGVTAAMFDRVQGSNNAYKAEKQDALRETLRYREALARVLGLTVEKLVDIIDEQEHGISDIGTGQERIHVNRTKGIGMEAVESGPAKDAYADAPATVPAPDTHTYNYVVTNEPSGDRMVEVVRVAGEYVAPPKPVGPWGGLCSLEDCDTCNKYREKMDAYNKGPALVSTRFVTIATFKGADADALAERFVKVLERKDMAAVETDPYAGLKVVRDSDGDYWSEKDGKASVWYANPKSGTGTSHYGSTLAQMTYPHRPITEVFGAERQGALDKIYGGK